MRKLCVFTLILSLFIVGDAYAIRGGMRSPQVQTATSLVETVTESTTNVTATTETQLIEIDATGGARGVTLPDPSTTTGVTFKIVKVDASTNAVTVDVAGGGLIGGATSYRLTRQYSTIIVTSNGTVYTSVTPNTHQDVDPRLFGATGDGSTDDSTALQNANDGANGEKIVISEGTYVVDANVTFTVPVEVAPGGVLSPTTGNIVVFEGPFDAPDDWQVFAGAGTIEFDSGQVRHAILPTWFGAVPNDSTDDSAALKAAETAADDNTWSSIIIPPGVYDVEDDVDFDPSVLFQDGAVLDPGVGDTVTFNGPVDAPNSQIADTADGDGTVVFSNGSTDVVLPIWMGVDPADGADDTDALQDAIDAGATNIKRVTIPAGVVNLLSNLDFSDTLVDLGPGATIDIGNGATLTVGCGKLNAGPYQIFTTTGTGQVVFEGDGVQEILPEWWGALGDNSTDCTAAFNAAMTAAQVTGVVYVHAGTYRIASPLNNFDDSLALGYLATGMTIKGTGTESVLRYGGTEGYCIEVDADDPTSAFGPVGVTIRDLHIISPIIADPDDGGCILVASGPTKLERITFGVNNEDSTAIHCRPRETTDVEDGFTEAATKVFEDNVLEKYAIRFATATRATTVHSVTVRLERTGTPGGNITASVYSIAANLPNTIDEEVSQAYSIDSISLSGEDLELEWGGIRTKPTIVQGGTEYFLVLEVDATYLAAEDGANNLAVEVQAGVGVATDTAEHNGTLWATPGAAVGANYTVTFRVGQAYQVAIEDCHNYISVGTARSLWMEDASVVSATNCYFRSPENIKSSGDCHFTSTGGYYLSSGTDYNIYADDYSQLTFVGGIIEAGITYMAGHGSFYKLIGVNLGATLMTWGEGTNYRVIGCNKDMFLTDDASVIPDTFLYNLIPVADDGLNWDHSGVFTTDAGAINGNILELNAINEVARVTVAAIGDYYGFLPRGVYRVTVWAKDTNQVANDCLLLYRHFDASYTDITTNTFTLTSAFRPYDLFIKVNSSRQMSITDITKRDRLEVKKATGTSNTISISHCVWQYLGPDKLGMDTEVIYATDESDSDGARNAGLEFWGTKADENQGVLARLDARHDGANDNYRGEVNLQVNTGSATYNSLLKRTKWDSDGTYIGDGGTTNYMQVLDDGEVSLFGTARVKKVIPMAGALYVGGTSPTPVAVGNYVVWEYDIGDDSTTTFELPVDWALGTDLAVELDWGINRAYVSESAEVQWNVTWSATPHDTTEALNSAGTTLDPGDQNIPAAAYYLTRTVIGTVAGASLAAGDEIGMKIERVTLDGGANPGGAIDPFITHLHVEYTADKLGESTGSGWLMNMVATYYADAANNTVHDVTTEDLGLAFWMKTNAASTGTEFIFSKRAATSQEGYALYLLATPSGRLRYIIRDAGGDFYYITGSTNLRDERWHHVAVIMDKSTVANCKIFVDGIDDTASRTGTLGDVGSLTNNGIAEIGAYENTDLFDGIIADLMIAYPANIMAANEMGAAGEIANLIAGVRDDSGWPNYEDRWYGDDGSATTVTGANNNCTLTNALAWEYDKIPHY